MWEERGGDEEIENQIEFEARILQQAKLSIHNMLSGPLLNTLYLSVARNRPVGDVRTMIKNLMTIKIWRDTLS